jgi:hypothetical protein
MVEVSVEPYNWPCFDLSVCPSLFCPSDWLAEPIACPSFPRLPSLFVDSLDSKLWYHSGCRATALASSSTLAVGQSFGSFSPHGARSKGDQQPDGRVAQTILGVDIEILATRALRARKTRKSVGRQQKTVAFDAVFGVVPTMSAAYTSVTCLTGVYLIPCTLYMGVHLTYGHVPYRRASHRHLTYKHASTHRRASHRHASHLKGCIS